MNAHRLHALAAAAALAAACAMTGTPALAAGGHAHDGHGSAPAKLALDHGKKWSTDDTLRSGMDRIRGLVEPQLSAAHADKLSPADYASVAAKVENEVAGIVANCKLEPKADAMLHLVIGNIGAGTEAMAGKDRKATPTQGLVKVAAAVNSYGRYFEHPGFRPIALGH
ncbi:hypothetical protein [Ramlibacter sp.]|uniref:hypothetical protein n=1 Tax=Ramlibacter sp. TaxID=1917967 RepID=UPI002CC3E126|nr:hypothetical protein [Ramlibacter sp.]HWI83228.1 hypothetical protein [Ramlibacter sp.]